MFRCDNECLPMFISFLWMLAVPSRNSLIEVKVTFSFCNFFNRSFPDSVFRFWWNICMISIYCDCKKFTSNVYFHSDSVFIWFRHIIFYRPGLERAARRISFHGGSHFFGNQFATCMCCRKCCFRIIVSRCKFDWWNFQPHVFNLLLKSRAEQGL